MCPIFLIAAVHCSDQEAADRKAWSLLRTRASILNAHTLQALAQDSPTYICVSVCARG